jgi:hypothetical protein
MTQYEIEWCSKRKEDADGEVDVDGSEYSIARVVTEKAALKKALEVFPLCELGSVRVTEQIQSRRTKLWSDVRFCRVECFRGKTEPGDWVEIE